MEESFTYSKEWFTYSGEKSFTHREKKKVLPILKKKESFAHTKRKESFAHTKEKKILQIAKKRKFYL